MDYLQYVGKKFGFWKLLYRVLNLVINGLPSILKAKKECEKHSIYSFKPCYKWITFNTKEDKKHQAFEIQF